MKGNMLGRSTPSPERAPDGPINLNGSIKRADSVAAALLDDQPAETGADARNGKAHADTPTEGLDPSLRAPPLAHAEVEQAAARSPASRSGAPEPGHSDEAGTPVGQANHDRPASAAGPEESAQKGEPGADMRASIAAVTRALLGRRGLRSTVFGVALAGLAVALGASSALSVSLLIVGVLFLIVGLMGPRLQGRLAVEFGPNGASIEIQTHMAPPGSTRLAAPLAPWKPTEALIASGTEDARTAHGGTSPAVLLGEIIDVQGETIERDVAKRSSGTSSV